MRAFNYGNMLGVGNYEWHDYFVYKFISEFDEFQCFHGRHELDIKRFAAGESEMWSFPCVVEL